MVAKKTERLRGRVKFTKRGLDGLEPEEKTYSVSDTEVRGLLIQVFPSGVKTFALKFTQDRRQKWITLGKYGQEITLDQARTKARSLRGEIADGKDPRVEQKSISEMVSVAKALDRFLAEFARPRLKPKTIAMYEWLAVRHIVPVLGTIPIGSVDRKDLASIHAIFTDRPRLGNVVLNLVSKLLNWCESVELRPLHSNPSKVIQRFPERKRVFRLEDDQLAALGKVLDKMESERHVSFYALAAIRLLILTGARRGEVLALEWDDVDVENGTLRFQDTKTGPQARALNQAAAAIFKTIPRVKDESKVFPWTVPDSAITAIQRAWRTVLKAWSTELNSQEPIKVRLHDLRHVHASIGLDLGLSLERIGALLGQRTQAVTERYSHLGKAQGRESSELVGNALAGKMSPKKGGFNESGC